MRDTPILTVVDASVPPVKPSFPRPKLFAVMTLVLALTMTVGRRIISAAPSTDAT